MAESGDHEITTGSIGVAAGIKIIWIRKIDWIKLNQLNKKNIHKLEKWILYKASQRTIDQEISHESNHTYS